LLDLPKLVKEFRIWITGISKRINQINPGPTTNYTNEHKLTPPIKPALSERNEECFLPRSGLI